MKKEYAAPREMIFLLAAKINQFTFLRRQKVRMKNDIKEDKAMPFVPMRRIFVGEFYSVYFTRFFSSPFLPITPFISTDCFGIRDKKTSSN